MNELRNMESESVKIMQQCPRFLKCSVPICPLDLLQDERTKLPGEPSCTLAKSIRFRIGKNTDLPKKGLTQRELSGRLRWDALSESEKQRRIAKLRDLR